MEQLELEKVARETGEEAHDHAGDALRSQTSTPAKLKKSSINSTNSHKTNSI